MSYLRRSQGNCKCFATSYAHCSHTAPNCRSAQAPTLFPCDYFPATAKPPTHGTVSIG
jgi:hypothetical protein